MKKTIATFIATAAVLATAAMPMMANATTATHANAVQTTTLIGTYSPNSLLSGSGTNTWGTDTLTSDDSSQEFDVQVTPVNSTVHYSYYMTIDYYTGSPATYVGSVSVPYFSGYGVQSTTVTYPQVYLGPGAYQAKLSGTYQGSDGSSGNLPTTSTCTFRYAI